MEDKDERVKALIEQIDSGKINAYNMHSEHFELVEPWLNEEAKNGQFNTLNKYIPQIYTAREISKRCGYTYLYDPEFANNQVLFWSILYRHINVVFNFLDTKSNKSPEVLSRALVIAIREKQADIVELLLDDECTPLNSDMFFDTAVRSDDFKTIQTLLQDDRFDPRSRKHHAFRLACELGHETSVKLLLPYSRAALQEGLAWALQNKRTEVLKLLLNEESIDPNEVLIATATNGHCEMVQYLLKTNTKINPATKRSLPLRLAVENNHLEIVRLFLEDGRAKPQALNNQAIRVASEKGFTDIVICLLADPRVSPEARQNDAIGKAVKNYRLETIKVLMEHTAVDLDFLVKCAVNYSDPAYNPKTFRLAIFAIIVENKRLNFEKTLEEVYKGPRYYHENIIELILSKANFSIEKLLQHSSNKECISSALVQTLGIFSRHHSENTQQNIPDEVIHAIGKLMVNTTKSI